MARITCNWYHLPKWMSSPLSVSVSLKCVIIIVVLIFSLALVIAFLENQYLRHQSPQHDKGSHPELPPSGSMESALHYGIVIDCGSSGSRIYVYCWPTHSGNSNELLQINQLIGKNGRPVVKKITPGLSTFQDNPHAASNYIKPLLNYASLHIPRDHHKETPLYILATAGMRMIPEKAQKAILSDLQMAIPKDFNFAISENHFEVITGKQEGVYAWIAVNYLQHKFSHGIEEHPLVVVNVPGQEQPNSKPHIRRRTVGIIDMGGASVQIAFEDMFTKHLLAEFNLGCQNSDLNHVYQLYVSTFLGYGANSARSRFEEMLLEKAALKNTSFAQNHPLWDPCLPIGLLYKSTDHLDRLVYFRGTGQYKLCKALLEPLLNLSGPCPQPPCSMNSVYQPDINFYNSQFYGFSEFWYTMDDVFRIGGQYDYDKFQKTALDYCLTRWEKLEEWYKKKLYPKAGEHRFRLQCFKAAWMTVLLHKGFKFPTDYHQFYSTQQIDSKDVQWTLGAVIHRTRYLPLREIEGKELQNFKPPWSKPTWLIYNEYLIIVCFLVVVMAILLYVKRLRLCPTKAATMTRVPSMSFFMAEENQMEQGYS